MPNPPNRHKTDDAYRNPPGSPERDASFSEYLKFFAARIRSNFERPNVPEGHVLPRAEALRQLDAHGSGESLTWLGHAAFLLRMGGRTVLIDPYLSKTAGPGPFGPRRFSPPGLCVQDLPPIDLLLISHNHYDHLDTATIACLPNKADTEVVVPLGLAGFFSGHGFGEVTEMDWYEERSVADLRIVAMPSVHWSKRGLADENKSLWCGFALESPFAKLYFSGDTGYGEIFPKLGKDYGPFDLSLIGIGAYEPRSIMHASHATPEEAAQIALDLRSRNVLGMHWGTVILSNEPPFEPPDRFHAAALKTGFTPNQIWRLAIGETRALPVTT